MLNPNTVFLDLETTGLPSKDPETEAVQICILNLYDKVLFTGLINPQRTIPEEVSAIHGITNAMVETAPTFPEYAPFLLKVLKNKNVICHNADFDIALLFSLFKKYGFPKPEVSATHCSMDNYSAWDGTWNHKKDGFKWQKLPNLLGLEAHNAINDCRNTRQLLIRMSGALEEPDPEELLDF